MDLNVKKEFSKNIFMVFNHKYIDTKNKRIEFIINIVGNNDIKLRQL